MYGGEGSSTIELETRATLELGSGDGAPILFICLYESIVYHNASMVRRPPETYVLISIRNPFNRWLRLIRK